MALYDMIRYGWYGKVKYGKVYRRVASRFFLVSPRDHFVCPVPSFYELKEVG